MCIQLLFIYPDCHCIARIGTYTCATQSIKHQQFSSTCSRFKTTEQIIRAAGRTCELHVGCVFERDVEVGDSSGDEELVLKVEDGRESRKGYRDEGREGKREVDEEGDDVGMSGMRGAEGDGGGVVDAGEGDGGREREVDFDTDSEPESGPDHQHERDPDSSDIVDHYLKGDDASEDEESSSSSSEAIEGEEVLEGIDPSEEPGVDDETFKSDSDNEVQEQLYPSGDPQKLPALPRPADIGHDPNAVHRITPLIEKASSSSEDIDDDGWVATSSPVGPSSPININRIPSSPIDNTRTPFSSPSDKDSPTTDLTNAMSGLSLSRTANSRIPAATRSSSVPRPTGSRASGSATSKQPSTSTGGLPYLRRTFGSGVSGQSSGHGRNTAVSVSVSGSPLSIADTGSSVKENRTSSTARKLSFERSAGSNAPSSGLPISITGPANYSSGGSLEGSTDIPTRRRIPSTRSSRTITSNTSKSTIPTSSTNTTSTNDGSSISKRSISFTAAQNQFQSSNPSANDENAPPAHGHNTRSSSGGGGGGLRYVGALAVAEKDKEKDLPALPDTPGNGRELPKLPAGDGHEGGDQGKEKGKGKREVGKDLLRHLKGNE